MQMLKGKWQDYKNNASNNATLFPPLLAPIPKVKARMTKANLIVVCRMSADKQHKYKSCVICGHVLQG